MPAPPIQQAFSIDMIPYEDDKWYSPFPPGWPAMLALGTLAESSLAGESGAVRPQRVTLLSATTGVVFPTHRSDCRPPIMCLALVRFQGDEFHEPHIHAHLRVGRGCVPGAGQEDKQSDVGMAGWICCWSAEFN